jgi:hypothetical protein
MTLSKAVLRLLMPSLVPLPLLLLRRLRSQCRCPISAMDGVITEPQPPGKVTVIPTAHTIRNGQYKGIPAATIGAYGARPLHKHWMFQITRALYRWDHVQIRRRLGNGSTQTQTIDFSTAQHQTSCNFAVTKYLRIKISR